MPEGFEQTAFDARVLVVEFVPSVAAVSAFGGVEPRVSVFSFSTASSTIVSIITIVSISVTASIRSGISIRTVDEIGKL